MILPIYTVEHEILHQKTSPVTEVTPELRQLVTDMRETMHNALGIGLAAPQIGQSIALCVLEYDEEERGDSFPFIALFNPRITWSSKRIISSEEACLSIPEVGGPVKRPDRVRVKAMNLDGKEIEIEAKGLLARAVQHEIDHLNGVVFTDHLKKKQLHYRETPDYPRI
jgi:peptide deformylase